MIGTTFSHYQILEKLGEGGMGQVYKARDTKLERFVAIKVLPPERTGDAERRARFIQEARAASALNHPNIITVHDIDSHDNVLFIAMEYVAGKTLDVLIPRKGMRLNEALKIGVQIAGALAKAHTAGIVHRDLKPGNVMVTTEGLVKVLDFGLAKLSEPAEARPNGVTRTIEAKTDEGAIVGTTGYMSPEQAEGKPVDARSDVFSFGALLYEMVTGHRAFQGDSKMSTLAAILNQEPAPLPSDIPHDLEKVISRCLRKDPARRFQHMADLKIALEELKEESESGKLSAPAVAAPKARRKWVWIGALAVIVALVAGGLAAWRFLRPAESGPRAARRLTHDGMSGMGALSPDGKLLVYSRRSLDKPDSDLWLQQVGGGQPVRLTNDPAEDQSPSFSPDGTTIVFRSSRRGGGIFVMPALGGEARQVAQDGEFPAFSPNGSEIACVRGAPALVESRHIQIVPASGGAPVVFQPDYLCYTWPVWSPDGSQILFIGAKPGNPPAVFVAQRNGGEPRQIGGLFGVWRWYGSKDRKSPEWLLATMREGDATTLCRLPVSSSGVVTGKSVTLASATHPIAFASVSTDGRIVFTETELSTNLWELPLEANSGRVTGPARQITSGHRGLSVHSISRDGSRIVFVSAKERSPDIVLKDFATQTERVLYSSSNRSGWLSLSPDGSQVAFQVHEKGGTQLYVVPAEGGASRLVSSHGGTPNGWSPDGSGVLCQGGTVSSVFLIDIATGKRTDLLRHPTDGVHAAYFSADGAWITFNQRLRPGHVRLLATPYRNGKAGGLEEWVAITDGSYDDDKPRLSPDGGRLYFQSNRDGFICVWTQRLDPRTKRPIGPPEAVQHYHGALRSFASIFGSFSRMHLSLGPDKLIVNLDEMRGDLWMTEAGVL